MVHEITISTVFALIHAKRLFHILGIVEVVSDRILDLIPMHVFLEILAEEIQE